MLGALKMFQRRRRRNRQRLRKVSGGRARLTVFRSNKNIYAQVVDDGVSKTVAAASTLDKEVREDYQTQTCSIYYNIFRLIGGQGKRLSVRTILSLVRCRGSPSDARFFTLNLEEISRTRSYRRSPGKFLPSSR